MKERLYDLLCEKAPPASDERTTQEVTTEIIEGLASILEKEDGYGRI